MKKIPGISAVFGGAQSFMGGVSNFFGGMFGGDKKSPVTAADSKSNVGGGSGEEAPVNTGGHKGGHVLVVVDLLDLGSRVPCLVSLPPQCQVLRQTLLQDLPLLTIWAHH